MRPITLLTTLLLTGALLLTSCTLPGQRSPLNLTPLPTAALAPDHINTANVRQLNEIQRIGDGALRMVTWSPDESRLSVVTAIGIYDYDPLALTRIAFHPAPIGDGLFALSQDGQLAAVGLSDATVQLWDIPAGHAMFDLTGVEAHALAFSPNGQRLAIGGWQESASGGLVEVWDTQTGRRLAQLEQDRRWPLDDLAFSPDGRQLTAAGRNTQQKATLIRVWDVTNTAQAQMVGEFETAPGSGLAFAPDGAAVLYGGELWDPHTGQRLARPVAGVNGRISFSPDGATIAAAVAAKGQEKAYFPDLNVQVWDRASGQLRWEQPAPAVRSRTTTDQLAFSPGGRWLVYTAGENLFRVWDAASGHLNGEVIWDGQRILSLAASPDGRTIAWNDGNYQLHLFDLAIQAALPAPATDISVVAFSPAGQLALCDRSELSIWNIEPQPQQILKLAGTQYPCDGLAFSPDSRLLVAGNNGADVIVWDLAARKQLPPLKGHTSSVVDVAFSRDGAFFVTASNDATVRIWRARDQAPLATLTTERDPGFFGLSVALAPDNSMIAGGTSKGLIWLWEPASGKLLRQLTGHTGGVRALAFSVDGSVLAASAEDGRIHLWDPQAGVELAILAGHTDMVKSLIFTSDGRQLLSASSDGTVRIWGIAQSARASNGM